jgi:hypothetical protein
LAGIPRRRKKEFGPIPCPAIHLFGLVEDRTMKQYRRRQGQIFSFSGNINFSSESRKKLSSIFSSPEFLVDLRPLLLKALAIAQRQPISFTARGRYLDQLESACKHLLELLTINETPENPYFPLFKHVLTTADEIVPKLVHPFSGLLNSLLEAITKGRETEEIIKKLARKDWDSYFVVIQLEEVFKKYNIPTKSRGTKFESGRKFERCLSIIFHDAGIDKSADSIHKLVYTALKHRSKETTQ